MNNYKFLKNVVAVLFGIFVSASLGFAQNILSFEDVFQDTSAYWDGSDQSGGFVTGDVFFPNQYDSIFNYWASGWTLSTMKDSTTMGFLNQFSARAGAGADGSGTYTVAYQNDFLGQHPVIRLKNSFSDFKKVPLSLSLTNTTYAYFSMKEGDGFSKKFGGPNGDDPDFFKLTIFGYADGNRLPDSVVFFLADFRFEDNSDDYILKDWASVDLSAFPALDSLEFRLSSSDVGAYGMNTPAYFCMDLLTIDLSSGNEKPEPAGLLTFPNPAAEQLFVECQEEDLPQRYRIVNNAGVTIKAGVLRQPVTALAIQEFQSGIYYLQLERGSIVRWMKL